MTFLYADDLTVSRCGPDHWMTEDAVEYNGSWETFIVPAGFVTDFATVPRFLTWLIPKYGLYTPAAVLHDYMLDELVERGKMSSRDADGVFRRSLRELGVPFAQRWLMWTGVRWGAAWSRSPDRRAGFVYDLPAVLLLSLLALPIVLPGVLGVLVGLGLYSLLRLLTGKLA